MFRFQTRKLEVSTNNWEYSYCVYLSSAQMLSYGFGNRGLLSNAEDLAGHAVFLFGPLHDTYNTPLPCFFAFHACALCCILFGATQAENTSTTKYYYLTLLYPIGFRLVPRRPDPED